MKNDWFVHIITLLLCAWSGGISFRFLLVYMGHGTVVYQPNTFDVWFDWFGLFILAIIVAAITIAAVRKSLEEKTCNSCDYKHDTKRKDGRGNLAEKEMLRVH